MICKDCAEEMTLVEMPQPVFTIPFTKGRFVIWDWHKKEPFCQQCCLDKEDDSHRRMIAEIEESIGRKAYEEGFRDGQMDW